MVRRRTSTELVETLENLIMIMLIESSTAIMMDSRINQEIMTVEVIIGLKMGSDQVALVVTQEDLTNSLVLHINHDVFMIINIYCRINIYKNYKE
jgi:hypothetical protein